MDKKSPEEKKALGKLAEMLMERYPNTNEITLTIGTSFRFPVDDLAWLNALARHSRESRNTIATQVIRAGVQELMAHLDEDTRRRLDALHLEEMDRLIESKGKSIEGDLFAKRG
jgi:hypothetical protein